MEALTRPLPAEPASLVLWAAFGASRPLRRIPAIVSFLNPQPALSLVGGNRSSCPEADLPADGRLIADTSIRALDTVGRPRDGRRRAPQFFDQRFERVRWVGGSAHSAFLLRPHELEHLGDADRVSEIVQSLVAELSLGAD